MESVRNDAITDVLSYSSLVHQSSASQLAMLQLDSVRRVLLAQTLQGRGAVPFSYTVTAWAPFGSGNDEFSSSQGS